MYSPPPTSPKSVPQDENVSSKRSSRVRIPSAKARESAASQQLWQEEFVQEERDESSFVEGDDEDEDDDDYDPFARMVEKEIRSKDLKEDKKEKSQDLQEDPNKLFLFFSINIAPNYQKNFYITQYTYDQKQLKISVDVYSSESNLRQIPFKLVLFEKETNIWGNTSSKKNNKMTPMSMSLKKNIFFRKIYGDQSESLSLSQVNEKTKEMLSISEKQQSFLQKDTFLDDPTYVSSQDAFKEESHLIESLQVFEDEPSISHSPLSLKDSSKITSSPSTHVSKDSSSTTKNVNKKRSSSTTPIKSSSTTKNVNKNPSASPNTRANKPSSTTKSVNKTSSSSSTRANKKSSSKTVNSSFNFDLTGQVLYDPKEYNKIYRYVPLTAFEHFLVDMYRSADGVKHINGGFISMIVEEMILSCPSGDIGFMNSLFMRSKNFIPYFESLLEDQSVKKIIGIYHSSAHFSVYVYHKESKKLVYFDPLYPESHPIGQQRLNDITEYLNIFNIFPEDWTYEHGQQIDAVHCGAYSMDYVERFVNEKPLPLIDSHEKVNPVELRTIYRDKYEKQVWERFSFSLNVVLDITDESNTPTPKS